MDDSEKREATNGQDPHEGTVDEEDIQVRDVERRDFLRFGVIAGAVGLAGLATGCSSSSDSADRDGDPADADPTDSADADGDPADTD